jgi:hypothetical protein
MTGRKEKIKIDDIEAIGRALITARQTNLGIEVEMPVVYPNGQSVSVVVTVAGGNYVVHDAGHGSMYLTESGVSLTRQLSDRLRRLAETYGCEFVSGRMTKAATEQQLAIAIALVANASRAVGDQVLEQREVRLRDFRREVSGAMTKFISRDRLKSPTQVNGWSGTTYRVSNVVLTPDRQGELAFVEPISDQAAVDRRYREFSDIANNEMYAMVQRISVYDDRQKWRDGDLAILGQVSNIVPFSSLPRRLQKLAA